MPNIFRPVFEPGDGPHAYAAVGRLAGARGLAVRAVHRARTTPYASAAVELRRPPAAG